jgi:hypothetical protein
MEVFYDLIYIKIGFEDFIKFVIKTSKIFSNIIKCRRSSRWMLRLKIE